ncbi:MAG: hypothetical protein JWP12_1689 [Bacteroidetes bacterium]|nr:hypothetical protein [Bacteroidota bacterium]
MKLREALWMQVAWISWGVGCSEFVEGYNCRNNVNLN